MTVMLPSVHEVLSERSPVVGAPSEAEAAAHTLLKMQQDLDHSCFDVQQAASCLSTLVSVAVTSVHASLADRLLGQLIRLSTDFGVAASAFAAYASAIQRIHRDARDTEDDVRGGLRCIALSAQHLERDAVTLRISDRACLPKTWDDRPGLVPRLTPEALDTVTPFEGVARAKALGDWSFQAQLWTMAVDQVQGSQARWRKLIAERVDAEQALITTLRQTVLGPLLSGQGTPTRVIVTRLVTGGAVHPSRWGADELLCQVLSGRLTPQQVTACWNQLGLTEADIERLPIESLFALAKTDGAPFWAQDASSRAALAYATANPSEALRTMGLTYDLSLTDFTEQIAGLNQAYQAALARAASLPGEPAVQLFGFGAHDGALTAAISFGDVDAASNIGLSVLGMGSSVTGFGDALGGADQLFHETEESRPGIAVAVVTWLGYRAPAMPPSVEVAEGERAASGAAPLARLIDGVSAVRAGSDPPLQVLAVFAHSYGSTTAAEALKITATQIDVFVTYGSAGFEPGTTLDQLHTERTYSTKAAGDAVAELGIAVSNRMDPRLIDGVTEFSAESTREGRRVTAHDQYTESDDPSFWNWSGKAGYLTAGTSAATSMGHILGGGTP